MEEYNRDKCIDEIIKIEFEAFDKTQNVGGRADCQDNWPMFYIMRKSQYMAWTDEMLRMIRDAWREYTKTGRNMITEKYGRMMESTAPDEYEAIKDYFPKVSDKARAIVDSICEIQVGWMKEFASEYPKLAGRARSIETEEDNLYNTSYETYLRGELLTYPEELIVKYAEFVIDLAKQGGNLARLIIENTAKLEGYKSLDEAEENL